jgi:hypothetical protein
VRRSSTFEHQFGKQPAAGRIYLTIRDFVETGSTIYVATDEPNRTFFEPLRKHYNLLFLGDFERAIDGLPTKYHGMIDQLVAAQGELFFGSWSSTFTGFQAMQSYQTPRQAWFLRESPMAWHDIDRDL